MIASRHLILFIILISILVSACGGGGGSTPAPPPVNLTLTGIVSKGHLDLSLVSAYKINDGVLAGSASSTANTSDGSYSIVISNHNGPVLLRVSGDISSQITCDAISGCDSDGDTTLDIPFGSTYTLPSGLTMDGIISSLLSDKANSITPLSHMISHRLVNNNTLDGTSIQQSIDTVEAIFNISDLLATQPLDITSSTAMSGASDPDTLKLALINAALMEIASLDYAGNISAMLSTLGTNFISNDGEIMLNNSDDAGGPNDADDITLAEITQAMLNTLDAAETTVTPLDIPLRNEILALNNFATTATTASLTSTDPSLSNEELIAAKGLIQTVNNWSVSFNELQTSHATFNDKMTLAGDMLRPASASAGAVLAATTVAMGRAYGVYLNQGASLAAAGKSFDLPGGITLFLNCDGSFTGTTDGRYQIIGQTIHFDNRLNPITLTVNEGSYLVDHFSLQMDGATLDSSTLFTLTGREVSGTVPTGNIASGSAAFDSGTVVVDTPSCSMDNQLASWLADVTRLSGISGTLDFTSNSVSITSGSITHTKSATPYVNTINLTLNLPALDSNPLNGSIEGVISNEGGSWTILNNGLRNSTVSFNRSSALAEQMVTTLHFDAISLSLETTIEQAYHATLMPDPASFDGKLTLSVIPTLTQGGVGQLYDYNPAQFTLDGIFSNLSGTTVDAQLSLDMSNANSFQIYSSIVGSYTKTSTVLELHLGSTNKERYTYTAGNIFVEYDTGSGYEAPIDMGPYASLDAYITSDIRPSDPSMVISTITGVGNYQTDLDITYGSSGNLSGTLDIASVSPDIDNSWGEHINNWRALQFSISYQEQLAGLPLATFTATGSRTGLDTGSANIVAEYDGITITISGNYNHLTQVTSAAQLYVLDNSVPTSPVSMTLNLDNYTASQIDPVTGNVTVDSLQVATIDNKLGGVIVGTFIDGSFMSIGF